MKTNPIFMGPLMIHYQCDANSYRELLDFLKRGIGESFQLTIGSDGAKGIETAVKEVFPNSVHLYCARHVRKKCREAFIKNTTST
jgi:transposase-like protein